jgi:hypothetical protein
LRRGLQAGYRDQIRNSNIELKQIRIFKQTQFKTDLETIGISGFGLFQILGFLLRTFIPGGFNQAIEDQSEKVFPVGEQNATPDEPGKRRRRTPPVVPCENHVNSSEAGPIALHPGRSEQPISKTIMRIGKVWRCCPWTLMRSRPGDGIQTVAAGM